MTQEYGSSPAVLRRRDISAAAKTTGYEEREASSSPAVADTTTTNGPGVGRQRTILPTLQSGSSRATHPPRADRPRYEAVKPIGEGAMGSVTLAQDHDIARFVAVKRLKTGGDSLAPVARFVEEIRTVGRLEHPNIVSIHDVGADEDGYFFVMRYLEGETLEDVIAKLASGDAAYAARYTFEYRIQLFLKVLDAVNYAHANGVLHRDIKPSNIIVGKHGEVTLADWGIAKPLETPAAPDEPTEHEDHPAARNTARIARTAANGRIGTPAYMSPEQVLGEPLDVRSDIYSLCATFYELLTTRYYLEPRLSLDADVKDLFAAVPFAEPVAPDTLEDPVHGHVPRELSFFVLRGLSKDRSKRFPSVAEMIDELQADLQGRTCVYCTSTVVKRGVNEYARFLDDHRVVGVAALAFAALFTIFGIVQAVLLVLRR